MRIVRSQTERTLLLIEGGAQEGEIMQAEADKLILKSIGLRKIIKFIGLIAVCVEETCPYDKMFNSYRRVSAECGF